MVMLKNYLHHVQSAPQSIAVYDGGASYSYEQFHELVLRIANVIEKFERPNVLIGLPQGFEAYASMVACQFAGGVYSPVNHVAPKERIRRILHDFVPDIVIGLPSLASVCRDYGCKGIFVDASAIPSSSNAMLKNRPHDISYVMYTSGSTGMPKGVMVSRDSLDHFLTWWTKMVGYTSDDRISQHPSIAFDLSVPDIYGGLSSGSCLVPFSRESDRLFPARKIKHDRISIWNSVPSVVGLMNAAGEANSQNLESVRIFTFCGEPLLFDHLDTIFTARPVATVFNTYGPTEATVAVTYEKITSSNYKNFCKPSAPLGKPAAGNRLHLEPTSESDIFELSISGPQVAEGYLRDPEATAARFGSGKQASVTGTKRYRTGDYVEKKGDHLFFAGRKDQMIKLRGFRVELGEVRAAFEKLGWFVHHLFVHEDRLCALLKRRMDTIFSEEEVRKDLASYLDLHAIPSHLGVISQLPLGPNDKSQLDPAVLFACLKKAQATEK
ncbi:AMP-binding protein (plasmid) [Agrobacterium sp. rho-8.1]|nr:AMP-binding protein [Agrobacterium sp. rho-8.1]